MTPIPQDACDCHVHVFAPQDSFPMHPARGYTPGLADAQMLAAHLEALGLARVIVVQPSIYGTDNRATLDAVARLGDRARGVAVVEDDCPPATLRSLHDGGIRGLRLNLAAGATGDLRALAHKAADLGWHLQIFADLATLAGMAPMLQSLPVPLMIDHFAGARAALGPDQPGLDAVRRLMGQGAYVKLAAPYLVSELPDHADCAALARAFAQENPERIVWGSNWPHPTATPQGIAPFRRVDDAAGLARLAEWIGPDAFHACLASNPARLFDF